MHNNLIINILYKYPFHFFDMLLDPFWSLDFTIKCCRFLRRKCYRIEPMEKFADHLHTMRATKPASWLIRLAVFIGFAFGSCGSIHADQSATITVGSAVLLEVTANGSSPFTYQWRKNGANISGATASTYNFDSIQQSDAGSYTVVVSNALGSTTSDIGTLSIVSPPPIPPSIVTQPQNQTVTAGAGVTLLVEATGSPSPTYQWRKGGINVSGATTAVFTLGSAQQADAGSYTVVVSNAAGSVTSSAATLTVNPAPVNPSIVTQPASQSVAPGGTATFTVTAAGTAPLTYRWKKNGTSITGATSAIYSIANVQQTLNGTNYTVVVTNSLGSVTSNNATLSVVATTVAPAITTHPQGATIVAGASVSFTVVATGTPTPTYQWRKNGINVSGATSATYSINGAQQSAAGSYSVVVTNSAGSATSNTAALVINPAPTPPTITMQPQGASVNQGATVSFSTTATGSSPLGYQWRKNGVAIPNAITAGYSITTVKVSDAGTYSVVVSNSAGTTTSIAAALTVAASVLPTFPQQPTSQAVPLGGSVTFTAVASGNPPPTYQWQKDGVDIPGATGASLSLNNIQPGDAGTYTVIATNSAGSVASIAAILTVSSQANNDFGGDGKADILWWNSVTGESSMWFMNGSVSTDGASLGFVPVEWVISGTGDFDGDGKADILWSDTVTGDHAMWMMNGGIIRQNAFVGTLTVEWEISGTGDFNGDGTADILWTNTLTGDRSVWLMTGNVMGAGSSYLTTLGVEWKVGGIGDFNGDGKADILWWNSVTGECSIWFMNGSVSTDGTGLGFVPVEWKIAGTADFNGDGKADILWADSLTGDHAMWLMNGGVIALNAFVGTLTVEWVVSGTGDYNGDGKADILWTNTLTGDRSVWLMDGPVMGAGSSYLTTLGVEWKVGGY